MGSGSSRGPAARWGKDCTHGWALMNPAERSVHQERMRALKTHEECKSQMAQHRAQMVACARTRGQLLPTPRGDACSELKP